MRYHIGRSKQTSPQACVKEACREFETPKLILYFSPVDSFKEYTELIHQQFPDSICMGATTIVEITKDDATKDGLLVVSLEQGISCSADVLEDVDRYPIKYVDRVKKCVQNIGNKKNTVCFEFTNAFKCAEESVLSTLNSALEGTSIPVFGGTAGNDTTSDITYVALNGQVYENSAVFVLIHNESGAIHYFRENIYKPMTNHPLVATKVDYVTRTVMEYNHEPAAKVFAKELGVAETQIGNYLDTNPMARVVGERMYITANCAPTENHGMSYHARIYENSKVFVLEPDNYRKVNEETMEQIQSEVPNPSFAIMCHCLARTLLFDSEGYMKEYAKKMGTVLGDYVGFSGYGEQMRHHQFNQTMAVIVFE